MEQAHKVPDRARTVPGNNEPVLDWFAGVFESVYAVLSPFLRVDKAHRELFTESDDGPTRAQLSGLAEVVSWSEVVSLLALEGICELNLFLLHGIGAARSVPSLRYSQYSEGLEALGLLEPCEGDFPAVLVDSFFLALQQLGYSDAIVGDEFGKLEDQKPIEKWLQRTYPWVGPAHPTLRAPDGKVLFGVHWDSFFTFLCGSRTSLEALVDGLAFEGFFFEPRQRARWHVLE